MGISFPGLTADTPPSETPEERERMSRPDCHDSREALQELSACRSSQRHRAGWASRTATTLGLALFVLAGVTGIAPSSFAEPATAESSSGNEPAIARDSEIALDSIFERMRNELDHRVQMKTEAIIRKVTENQIHVLLLQFEQNLKLSSETSQRAEHQLAELSQ